MPEVGLEVDGRRAVPDFSKIAQNVELSERHVRQLLPLLVCLISADDSSEVLPELLRQQRVRPYVARSMICQASLVSSRNHYETLLATVDGTKSISDLGCLELEHNEDDNV